MTSVAGELLLLRLSPVVVRALVKLWVGDSALLEESAGTISEMLARSGVGRLERRRIERELEAVGERVAERLEPFLMVDRAGGIERNELEAAIAEAADTIEAGFTSADAALEANMDARALEHLVRAARPRAATAALLHPKAVVAYDFIIRESCAYLVQMVAEMPRFAPLALSELLSRTANLENLLTEALDALPPSPDLGSEDFETRYRRAVVQKLDWMTLLGLRGASRASQRYALSVAYISLLATVDGGAFVHVSDDLEDEYDDEDEGWLDSAADDSPAADAEVTLRVEQLVARHPWLIIGGIAGSGKTTVLQWLAVKAANASFAGPLHDLNEMVPVFVRLRDYADDPLPGPEAMADSLAGVAADLRPDGWTTQLLSSGTALVLIDGIDELSDTRRADVSAWLEDLCINFPDSRFIATARPAALEGWPVPDGFAVSHLAPMSVPDVDAFVEHWHQAAGHPESDQAEKQRLTKMGEALKQVLRIQAPLRRLATNPLMCAVICALHRDGGASLPKNRIELYDTALDMLLDQRDRARRITTNDLGLSKAQKSLLLQDIAWWMISNGYADALASHVAERIVPQLERMGISTEPELVVRYLVERTGVVRRPSVGHVDFVHKTFMEYLAAQRAVAENDLGLIVRSAEDLNFQEVAVLAAGAADPARRDSMIRQLMLRAQTPTAHQHSLVLIAAQCVDLAPDLDPTLRAAVDHLLSELIPPRKLTDAERLATAGDVAVPMLPYSDNLSREESRASVRALIRIGTPAALAQLSGYARDRRKPVVRELVSGWDVFDRDDYAQQVMASSPLENGFLRIDAPESLRFVQWLKGLRDLEIRTSTTLDAAGLSRAPEVRSLTISEAKDLLDLGALGGLNHLSSLRIGRAPDLQSLAGIESFDLTRLYLDHAPMLSSLGALERCPPTLVIFRLRRSAASDLQPLTHQGSLKQLVVDVPYLESLQPIEELAALSQIEISGAENDLDLHWLTATSSLRSVRLTNLKGLLGFSPFGPAGVPLTSLSLENCAAATSVRALGEIGNVRELSLIRLPLSSLAGLTRIVGPALQRLSLGSCPLSDINAIPASVTKLELRSLETADLSPLAKVPALTTLSLANLDITDLDGLRHCEHLTDLHLGTLPRLRDLRAIARIPALQRIEPGPFADAVRDLNLTGIEILPQAGVRYVRDRRLTLLHR